MKVAICDYGAGNVRSVAAAFRRLGTRVVVTSDPEPVIAADVAVLPGVGSAASAMKTLHERDLVAALRARAREHKATLGICLGLQLALDGSEEDGGTAGLGLVPGYAKRLRARRVPRMGWALVEPLGATFYFAHSYAAETPAATAWSEGVVAAARHGSFLGVQFHPEKSGPAGAGFLKRCLYPA